MPILKLKHPKKDLKKLVRVDKNDVISELYKKILELEHRIKRIEKKIK